MPAEQSAAGQSAMSPSPQAYQSLSAQVAARIRLGIQERTWVGWLPGERTMAKSLQVSRKTLRKALGQLERAGNVQPMHGLGHRIVNAGPPVGKPGANVGLLTPESLATLRPYTALWVDELRSLLFSTGMTLSSFFGHRYFSARPDKALARLVRQAPHQCWVLAHSNERIQNWFYEHGVPCIVAGSAHAGLPLPSVDLDYFAVCRHAAGAMLRLGHRRVALFAPLSQRAGDLESQRGFEDGMRRSTRGDADPIVAHHDGTVDGAHRALARLFDQARPPTAILVANPVYYLTTISFLAQRGLRVPRDVSLLSRDDDTFLSYLRPEPARYSCQPAIYAKRLLVQLQATCSGETGVHAIHRIEPKFVPGPSLAAPPPR